LLLRPPDAISPAFGEGSCERHLEAARSAGLPYGLEPLQSLALDLDTPADLIALTREIESGRGRAPHTAKALGL
jgi:2-phospho-L-lactate guanylyltransferase (CobY/MobA/RfbA family)